jgi:hypothetical protein
LEGPIPQFGIRCRGLNFFLSIGAEDFSRLRAAHSVITEALAIEEKFDLIVSNYLELEATFNAICAEHLVRSNPTPCPLDHHCVSINRRVQNLVNAGQAYLAYFSHLAVHSMQVMSQVFWEFSRTKKKQHDQSSAFRLIDSIANGPFPHLYPVVQLRITSNWEGQTDKGNLLVQRIEARFWNSLIQDRNTGDHSLDLDVSGGRSLNARSVLRDYVGQLSAIHQTVRTHMVLAIAESQSHVQSAALQFRERFSDSDASFHLTFFESDADGRYLREFPLPVHHVDRLRRMLRSNSPVPDLEHWVTSTY